MKRAALFLALTMIGGMFAGCSASKDSTTTETTLENAFTEMESSAETSETTTETTTEATTAETVKIEEKYQDFFSQYASFEVTSTNLNDGVWDDITSNTERGENKSPALSWTPVEGATQYVIYMIDTSVNDWMHWKSGGVTETDLPLGWAAKSDYVGPYPPNGSCHTYEVYVLALKNPVEKVKGAFNTTNSTFQQAVEALDTDVEGNTGNIVACGHIAGKFTH